jgi:hypothetical protein
MYIYLTVVTLIGFFEGFPRVAKFKGINVKRGEQVLQKGYAVLVEG